MPFSHRSYGDARVLAHGSPGLRITYEDSAPPFNPYARAARDSSDAPLETRKVGGLGAQMTRELTSTCDYAYLYGRNRIELTFRP